MLASSEYKRREIRSQSIRSFWREDWRTRDVLAYL